MVRPTAEGVAEVRSADQSARSAEKFFHDFLLAIGKRSRSISVVQFAGCFVLHIGVFLQANILRIDSLGHSQLVASAAAHRKRRRSILGTFPDAEYR